MIGRLGRPIPVKSGRELVYRRRWRELLAGRQQFPLTPKCTTSRLDFARIRASSHGDSAAVVGLGGNSWPDESPRMQRVGISGAFTPVCRGRKFAVCVHELPIPRRRFPLRRRRRSARCNRSAHRGDRSRLAHQTLLGVTGSGKTFTMAKVIERVGATRAGAGSQQDAGRAALRRDARILPAQRRRVFCLLLRLLPAGGPTSRRPIPTSRRTRRSTITSSRCGCRRRRPCSNTATASSLPPCHRSTVLATPLPITRWCCTWCEAR